jgi:hypothetical protein
LIGPGGKVIQELQKTGTTIVINEDPITEEGVIEELILLELKQYWLKSSQSFKPKMNGVL